MSKNSTIKRFCVLDADGKIVKNNGIDDDKMRNISDVILVLISISSNFFKEDFLQIKINGEKGSVVVHTEKEYYTVFVLDD